MNTNDPNLPPPAPPPIPQPPPLAAIPINLSYSSLQPIRPGIITATGVIGIIIAILGLIVAAFEALQAVLADFEGKVVPTMQWQTTGVMTAYISEAIVGAALAITLLVGSSGLLRQRSWSRRVLLWWGVLYLTSVLIFLLLQIMVVVPDQIAMMTNMMATMPVVTPTTNPSGATATTATTTFSYSVAVGGGATTTMAFPAAPAGPSQAQMATVMSYGYSILAYSKAIICLIFPIAVLIVMQLKSVRSALKTEPEI